MIFLRVGSCLLSFYHILSKRPLFFRLACCLARSLNSLFLLVWFIIKGFFSHHYELSFQEKSPSHLHHNMHEVFARLAELRLYCNVVTRQQALDCNDNNIILIIICQTAGMSFRCFALIIIFIPYQNWSQ